MTQRFILDAVLDPAQAKVVVTRDPAGHVTSARFDLSGLPRVDTLLAGRPVAEVPPLVERLCGVCPAAHHLAGVRALEALAGITAMPAGAERVRRLLHHGAVLSLHVLRFLESDAAAAVTLRRFAQLAMAAAGSPGHFPATAVVGGVAEEPDAAALERCAEALDGAVAAAQALCHSERSEPCHSERSEESVLTSHGSPERSFAALRMTNVALVDADGRLDLMGEYLRAVDADGLVVVDRAPAAAWDTLVAESRPGEPAPRPYLAALGPDYGHYRVGPLAQVAVAGVATPLAAERQAAWRRGGGGALAARAVMVLHCVEAIGELLAATPGPATPPAQAPARSGPRTGVGWVDGARGLLVHRYAVDENDRVTAAQVLTPTAQNENWLACQLGAAVGDRPDGPVAAGLDLEEAVKEADPCLPCSLAPAGTMGLLIETVAAGEGE
jgi:NAD-reducing hydrogenase large subunit